MLQPIKVITPFHVLAYSSVLTAEWLLYVPQAVILRNSTQCICGFRKRPRINTDKDLKQQL
jgi:hypothetical protein